LKIAIGQLYWKLKEIPRKIASQTFKELVLALYNVSTYSLN